MNFFRRHRFTPLVLALLIGPSGLLAQDETPYFTPGVGPAIPNVLLPHHVPAPVGKLTLFADFAAPTTQGIPLYLVNRTASPVRFSSQDGDIYLKLEHVLSDGTWERAQRHRNSWCGNSYIDVDLGPGQHFAFHGYMPKEGIKARVRFASYNTKGLISNEGEGFFLERDVAAAQRDPMGRGVPFCIELLIGSENNRPRDSSVTPQMQVAALRLVQASGNNPYYKEAAEKLAAAWEANPAATLSERQAAKAIRKIVAEPWPPQRSSEALLTRCREALIFPHKNEGLFGRLEEQPTLVWNVLGELAASGKIEDINKWRPVVEYAKSHPDSFPQFAPILENRRIADEMLPNQFFENNLFSADRAVQRLCAGTLSRRQQWATLANLAWKLDPEGQVLALKALAYPASTDPRQQEIRRDPHPGVDWEFWKHCMETQPLESSYALCSGHLSEHNSFNRIVHDPLHKFLRTEAGKSAVAAEDFDLGSEGYKMRMAVEFLASWHMEEDIPVFQKLLEYRGYQKSEGSRSTSDSPAMKPFVIRKYAVRDAARRALLRQGQPVKPDLVLEKDVTP